MSEFELLFSSDPLHDTRLNTGDNDVNKSRNCQEPWRWFILILCKNLPKLLVRGLYCEAVKSGNVEKVKDLRAVVDGLTALMHAVKQSWFPWNALTPSNLSAGDSAIVAGHRDLRDSA